MDNVVKLSRVQQRELKILQEFGHITTEGRGHRHNTLINLCNTGMAIQDAKYRNIFTITAEGHKYIITNG